MDSDSNIWIESFTRWIHVVAGITWIGHLYFFNFVNANLQPKLDGPTKKLVNPQLLPRALFWFRWGAMFTFLSGLLLFYLVYMHATGTAKNPNFFLPDGGITNRGWWIIFGALFGTVMWFNVWFVIWPAQKQIIPKVRDGVAPDAAIVKRGALFSKINTYLSVPLVAFMLSQHFGAWLGQPLVYIPMVIVVGFAGVWLWYKNAPKVQGM
ncbi:MAG TPA: urate hydroxylase PuuD [Planctomycetota bacterium]|nr:urate hydroxylase PuuD [Planctomycetota bacterium]